MRARDLEDRLDAAMPPTLDERLAAVRSKRAARVEKQRQKIAALDERIAQLMARRADEEELLARFIRAHGTVTT